MRARANAHACARACARVLTTAISTTDLLHVLRTFSEANNVADHQNHQKSLLLRQCVLSGPLLCLHVWAFGPCGRVDAVRLPALASVRLRPCTRTPCCVSLACP
uniref:Uncharacterized protein n=1 Tax=Chrysotila carterae TaxID=13221 RepID=A0A7S4BHA7_CHRCT